MQEIDINSTGLHSPKIYVVTVDKLLRYADSISKTPEGVLELRIPRLELFKDNSIWKYGFALTAHGTSIKFITSTKEETYKWYNILKKNCMICTVHFSKNYTITKLLKRSTYYKMQEATNNETNEKYIIKSISKPNIVDNETRIVIA